MMAVRLLIILTILSALWAKGAYGVELSVCFPDEEDRKLFEGCECDDAGTCEGVENGYEVECPAEVGKRMTEFPRVNGTYNDIDCLIITSGQFTKLQKADLAAFPNLQQLELIDGKLNQIINQAFSGTPNLMRIELPQNELTAFPDVSDITKLEFLTLDDNRIQSLTHTHLLGLTNLTTLNLRDNDIKMLEDRVFDGLGNLFNVRLSGNPNLRTIGDEAFVIEAPNCNPLIGCGLGELDLSFTAIEMVPTKGLQSTLVHLFLNGTRSLKRFNAHMMHSDGRYHNLTFPRLQKVSFHYSALCCQYRDLSYIDLTKQGNTVMGCSLPTSPPTDTGGDGGGTEGMTVCYDTSTCPLEVVNSTNNTATVSVEDLCTSVPADCCPPLSVCPDGCGNTSNTNSSSTFGVMCVTTSCYSETFLVNETNGNCSDTNCSTAVLTCKSSIPCPTPALPPSPSPSPTPIVCPLEVDPCHEDYCPWKACSINDNDEDEIDICRGCQIKSSSRCATDLTCMHRWETCNCFGNKRSTHRYDSMPVRAVRSVDPPPEGWFYLNTSVICYEGLYPTPTPTLTPIPTPTSTPCDPYLSVWLSAGLSDEATSCMPMNDPFNPCEDLLGSNHALRVLIWPVIIIALLGNVIVIFVIVGYVIIIRRTKLDTFIMHFLYLNLAVADLMMGIYLFTIAVVDLDTLGTFSLEDVEWRTGPGCGFAGFLAITSTVASVFMLVVITLERTYTILNVMHQRKISRITIYIIVVCGWILAVLMGSLPLVGVSDYSAVAICLPFDISTIQAKVYVTFMLVGTGLAFLAIAVSYGVIFYEVFCSSSKRRLHNSTSLRNTWKTELRVGMRMSLLVFTNFVCWFPIAFLALTAAYGSPLVRDVSVSKFMMVFVFPLNACLNPILYSLLTKVFRQNFCLLLNKIGLFRNYNLRLRSQLQGYPTPSNSSTQPLGATGGRRGTIMSRLISFASFQSTSDLSSRRGSTMSQGSMDESRGLPGRRFSNFSSSSGEDPTMHSSPNQNNFFDSANEEPLQETFVNESFRASSPTRSKGASKAKIRISSLNINILPDLPEEIEAEASVTPIYPTGDALVQQNPAYGYPEEEEKEQMQKEGVKEEKLEEDEVEEAKEEGKNYQEEGYSTNVQRDSDKGTAGLHDGGGREDHFPRHRVDTDSPQGSTPSSEEGIELKTCTEERESMPEITILLM